ncbi:hypothetical protein [Rhizobium tubonense]|uniref:Uncharacterized protein n=1 Tax=Rhizobium tubonense TaxID=484088 RepID=A0A2W4CRB8_9HYPH|nr:hypothetical protein [Rhizobium tubonense]PZM07984.1 hypothetical protein CPY51_29990 [Rhizobium tubonense]
MVRIYKLSAAAIIAAMAFQAFPAMGEDAISNPAQKMIGKQANSKVAIVPELAVLNSGSAEIKDGRLILSSVSANTIVFTDRPARAVGHVLTSEFIKQWGDGADSFKSDPPNATVSVLNNSGVAIKDAVVVLKSPVIAGSTLAFNVDVLEGDLNGADGPAAVFIDWFSGSHSHSSNDHDAGNRSSFEPPQPAFKAGWYRHDDHRGLGWTALGALGATAGAVAEGVPQPYDYPPYIGYAPYGLYPTGTCGFYPEPPCY